jgi:hypothetical protein
MVSANPAQQQTLPPITAGRALLEAESDALRAYGDLSLYRVAVGLESDGWHIDYELKDHRLQGGGPHYVIDPTDGRIVRKRYEQ